MESLVLAAATGILAWMLLSCGQRRAGRTRLTRLRRIERQEFETWLGEWLAAHGHGGKVAARADDARLGRAVGPHAGGVWLAGSEGELVAVGWRRYAPEVHVGSSTLEVFLAALEEAGARRGVFVTTSSFTPRAAELAALHQLTLVEGRQLVDRAGPGRLVAHVFVFALVVSAAVLLVDQYLVGGLPGTLTSLSGPRHAVEAGTPAPAAAPPAAGTPPAPSTDAPPPTAPNPVPPLRFVALAGGLGGALGQFDRPYAVTVDRQGNLYVADTNNHRVQRLSPAGQPLAQWGGGPGDAPGQFRSPSAVAVDAAGRLYVADTYNHRIQALRQAQ